MSRMLIVLLLDDRHKHTHLEIWDNTKIGVHEEATNIERINFIPLGSILLRMYYKYITQVY
jgi:hypothetical protein